jgi:isopentenyl-diphosphate Delta-isomerase
MTDEIIDIVDSNNNVIGKEWKSIAHKKGLPHRATHIWIYNSRGEILIQKRAKEKTFFADLWDFSAAGHIPSGETPEEASIREINEELGIEICLDDLKFIEIRNHKFKRGNEENIEFNYIYLVKWEGDFSDVKIQKLEIQEAKLVNANELRNNFLEHPDKYTPGKDYWLKMIDLVLESLK